MHATLTNDHALTPSQLSALLDVTIPAQMPVLITSSPGIGKSDLVTQAAARTENRLITYHPVTSDPTDYKGLGGIVEGRAEWLPFGDLRALIEADAPTIAFLDDLGQAPPAVQAAAMQLILARRINGHRVSDHVTFIAATNRRQDRAAVSGILEPVKSRFVSIVELRADLDDWIRWAIDNALPMEAIAFIRWKPELLSDFKPSAEITQQSPCPRTVAHAARLWDCLQSANFRDEAQRSAVTYAGIAGAAGEGFASEFLGFIRIWQQLPNPDAVIMDPENAEIPTDPSAKYALCGALAIRAKSGNIAQLVTYANRLPDEFATLLIRDCRHFSAKSGDPIDNTRPFVTWTVGHPDVF